MEIAVSGILTGYFQYVLVLQFHLHESTAQVSRTVFLFLRLSDVLLFLQHFPGRQREVPQDIRYGDFHFSLEHPLAHSGY